MIFFAFSLLFFVEKNEIAKYLYENCNMNLRCASTNEDNIYIVCGVGSCVIYFMYNFDDESITYYSYINMLDFWGDNTEVTFK